MDQEAKAFLILIIQTLSVTLLWMLVNMTAGVYFNLAFFEGRPGWANIIYYIFLIASFIFSVRYLKTKWKGFKELN
jgi:hypothetical protein